MPNPTKQLKAYKVMCNGFAANAVIITWNYHASKARHTCWSSAREAGYNVHYKHFRVLRIPEFDKYPTHGVGKMELYEDIKEAQCQNTQKMT